MNRLLLAPLLLSFLCLSSVSGQEKQAFVELFDGRTLNGWTTMDGSAPRRGWQVKNGELQLQGRGGHLLSTRAFGDFELEFEWRISKGGNAGIKYRVRWYGDQPLGLEYQLLDDANHRIGPKGKQSAGSIYALYGPSEDKQLKPAGEFNHSRIIVRDGHIEHWLNGKRIVQARVGDPEWKKRVAQSKFSKRARFAQNHRGALLLQDHGNAMAFRRIAIRSLDRSVEAKTTIDFDRQIRPLLADACFRCHGPDADQRQADLRLDQQENAFAKRDAGRVFVPGDPDASLAIRHIMSDDPDTRMPPPDERRQLDKSEIELLRRWIKDGANWSKHWAFRVPQRPLFPTIKRTAWPRNGIDYFVLAKLEEAGLSPSPPAGKEALLRRVTLDLTGLPPTLAEIDEFLADRSPSAYEKVVDRLLKSPHYGEHMALPWLDAARYADTNGYQQDRTRTSWYWRDWVVEALNKNLPFDRFTIEQLAGDLLPKPTIDQQVATGFHRNHMLNGEGGRIAEESRIEYVVDRVETTGAVWLGMTVGCARCHDHKYDPISQKEFYRLFAFFNNIEETGSVDRGGNANPIVRVPTPEQAKQISSLEREVSRLEGSLKSEGPAFAVRQEAWEKRLASQLKSEGRLRGWTAPKPQAASAANGSTLKILPDRSILSTKRIPAKDDYKVVAQIEPQTISAIRLEALTHPSLKNGGPGRTGNFVLTHLEARVRSAKSKEEPVNLELLNGVADFEQKGFAVGGAIDPSDDNGWAIWSPDLSRHQSRTAVFRLKTPVEIGEPATIEFTLRHQSKHVEHLLGRFRLSVTDLKDANLETPVRPPASLVALLRKPPGDRSKEESQQLASFFRKSTNDKRRIERAISVARAKISALRDKMPVTMVMRERRDPRKTFVLKRGVWDQPDKSEQQLPDVPACLPKLSGTGPRNRLDLARWIASPRNPLTARVAVNRFWQHFFGSGLVLTPEDFGTQGERPTHPELLDWMATEFVRLRWNTKALHKLIVMSAVYRQSSASSPKLLERDPYNRLLARGARFRLSSHAIRDQALAISGLLVQKLGGPPVKPYQPGGIWSDQTLGKIKYQRDKGEGLYRRSLYTFWRRSVGPTMLFDTASRQVCTVRPARTNTPLHALTLMNDITFVEASRMFAEGVMKKAKKPSERLALAFRMATARRPNEREREALAKTLNAALAHFRQHKKEAEKLLQVGDHPRDKKLDAVEAAAYASVMSLILNLDEVISKE